MERNGLEIPGMLGKPKDEVVEGLGEPPRFEKNSRSETEKTRREVQARTPTKGSVERKVKRHIRRCGGDTIEGSI